jgi:fructose-bisphosphate aldolase, class I
MKAYRLNRLFHQKSRRCFDVALDHGIFGEQTFLKGIENLEESVQRLVSIGPDAIQLTVGQAGLLQSMPGKSKPALVLRTDTANVYGERLPKTLFSRMIESPVRQAVQLDAACVVANLFCIPEHPEVTEQCIQNICRLKTACDRWSMPLMIEPLVLRPNRKRGGYAVDGDLQKILALVRQATELGADVLKVDPVDDPSEYHRVIEIARVPVLVRGGGKISDREILERTESVIEQGAAGIVYGRNITQHKNPKAIVRALMAIVHEGKSAREALRFVGK